MPNNDAGTGGAGGLSLDGITVITPDEDGRDMIEADAGLIAFRKDVCSKCEFFRTTASGTPSCTAKCGAFLEYKWKNQLAKCCQGKW